MKTKTIEKNGNIKIAIKNDFDEQPILTEPRKINNVDKIEGFLLLETNEDIDYKIDINGNLLFFYNDDIIDDAEIDSNGNLKITFNEIS